MGTEIDLFHFDDDRPNFEGCAQENGFRYWCASALMQALGYDSMQPVTKAINKAIAACAQLEIPIGENFVEIETPGFPRDWRLSRFACYLTVMNGDPRNAKIARAQAYFATMTEAVRLFLQEADGVERVLVRGEISEREKMLTSTASVQGVTDFALFQNAGYRGLYNMNLSQIRRRKQVPSGRSPLDFMGKTELAANLFRITQTEEKIRNEDIRGQRPLENAAEDVGREVRNAMVRISGTRPEDLPPSRDVRELKKDLKHTRKQLAMLDGDKPGGKKKKKP